MTMREYSVECRSPTGTHRLHVTEWGAVGHAPVLICAHGLTRCGRDFDWLARAMSDRYRVVCPDIAGRGRSDWLTDKMNYGTPQYLADMHALLHHLDTAEVHWVGTSMGGILGMCLAAEPDSLISKMVVNDVGNRIPRAALARIAAYVGMVAAFPSFDAIVAASRAVSPFGPLSDEEWRTLTAPLVRQDADGLWRFRYDPGIAEPLRQQPLADVDLTPVWDAIRCPMLVTRGAESDLLEKATFETMCRKPGVRGIEFPHTGHAPMFVHEETIAPVRDFLLGSD